MWERALHYLSPIDDSTFINLFCHHFQTLFSQTMLLFYVKFYNYFAYEQYDLHIIYRTMEKIDFKKGKALHDTFHVSILLWSIFIFPNLFYIVVNKMWFVSLAILFLTILQFFQAIFLLLFSTDEFTSK